MAQLTHTSIRISESENAFLVSTGRSILEATRIGIMALRSVVQSDSGHPCIYLARTGECGTHPVAQQIKASIPPSACCPGCPVRNGLVKRYLAADCHGMNDPAFNPAPLIDVQEQPPSLVSPDPIIQEIVPDLNTEPDPCIIPIAIADTREPEPEPVITAAGKCIHTAIEIPTPARDQEIMARLKKERGILSNDH